MSILRGGSVELLVDVRTVPRSRRNPQFEGDVLSASLRQSSIDYLHERALGGFRRPAPGSVNDGWQQPAFRGYADYMATREFGAALARLEEGALDRRTCIMCAEAQWWRCHRRLISDALLVRGWRVLHLGLRAEPVEHTLTPFAVLRGDGSLTYPAQPSFDTLEQAQDEAPPPAVGR